MHRPTSRSWRWHPGCCWLRGLPPTSRSPPALEPSPHDGGGGRSNIDIRHLSLKTVTKIASPRAASAPQFLASPPVPNCSLDGFSQWRMVKLPNTENATAVGNRTLNECRDFCSWNCSCMMW
ncbi:uncharacterized protein LOC122022424 [Zingiber officinale]|uniref:uncharacterized protein LOC122022424 n=1 Tax=Zingiber officinale TaxID=94328 RepID=UPI001C4BD4FA|nr:uncharacterized protein LOC122022424 [Zingiber officinale]